MIKNIIFDFGGVLVPLNKQRCLDNFKKIGVTNFDNYLGTSAQKGFFAKFENGDIGEDEFRDGVRKLSRKPDLQDSEIDLALQSLLEDIPLSTVKTIETLTLDYNLYILSNNNPIAWAKCVELFDTAGGKSLSSLFKSSFLSFRMNLSKPGAEIFNRLVSLSGININETLFIDDAIANIECAKQLGFYTLLFDINKDFTSQIVDVTNNFNKW